MRVSIQSGAKNRSWMIGASIAGICAVLASCTPSQRRSTAAVRPLDAVQAHALYDTLRAAQQRGDLSTASRAGEQLLAGAPGFPERDDALLRVAQVALAAERYTNAASDFDRIAAARPEGDVHNAALVGAADAYGHLDDPMRSAERLLDLLSGPVDAATRDRARARLQELARSRLGPAQMEALVNRYPDSPLAQAESMRLARRAYAGGNYDKAYRLLAELIYRFPRSRWVGEARQLLSLDTERRQAPTAAPATPVDPQAIGVLMPITGPMSLYGRYFEQGVDEALDEYNAQAIRPVRAVKADTKGRPVAAVEALRRVVQEDGVVAVVGPVFTMPVIAAAVESNAWRTPLVSPVTASDNLGRVGPWIFQTRVSPNVEVMAMAHLAVRRLFLTRYAVITPQRGARRKLADSFREAVERLGGTVVAFEVYDEGATDYREQLEPVREAAAEALFAPGSVEELLLLLPQIKFYDMQVQLLGLSNWKSAKLLRLSRDDLEGALFPADAYYGADRAAYENFRSALEAKGITEVSPVAVASYAGMRLLLEAIGQGATSRGDLRTWLSHKLHGTAEQRMAEADGLSILVVHDGRTHNYTPPESSDPFN